MISSSIAAKSSLFEPSSPNVLRSSTQWKAALRELKLLYNQRQYKRCVARSSSILSCVSSGVGESIHPVYRTYLNFYSAICYELMSRYVHDYSRNKIPLLHSALDCFGVCLGGLPDILVEGRDSSNAACGYEIEYDDSEGQNELGIGFGIEHELFSVPEYSGTVDSLSRSSSPSPSTVFSLSASNSSTGTRSTTPAESILSSIKDIIDKTLDCPDDDPFLSDHESDDLHGSGDVTNLDIELDIDDMINNSILSGSSCNKTDNDEKDAVDGKQKNLIPSPLQVRKTSGPRPLIPPCLEGNANQHIPLEAREDIPAQLQVRKRPRPLPLPLPFKTKTKVSQVPVPGGVKVKTTGIQPPAFPSTASPKISRYTDARTKSYNASIIFLHKQITTSIATLRTLLQEVQSQQQARATSRRSLTRSVSFWSFSPVKDPTASSSSPLDSDSDSRPPYESPTRGTTSKHESMKDRVVRLRAEGWETVGLKNRKRGWKGSEHYKEFCSMVLDELYLGV
ncbi:hypothetical protein BJX99DRAFT_255623 [Aspergillus californicus]